jgi:F-type H+-transporting ATPase subunit a
MPKPFIITFFLGSVTFIAVINFIGLTPYTFTSTSNLSVTFSISISFYLLCILSFFSARFLIHLVPLRTPLPLIPLMTVIELISNLIRPLTLSVRLAANIVAGHLLLSLVNNNPPFSLLGVVILVIGVLLYILELAVSLIQAYVFSTLRVI